MTYCLLTGAAGLLGSYLLRDCLVAGHRMAVLVRPTRTQSAEQRVNASLAHWEEQTGRTLPRPIVLEGDLCRTDLGLSHADLRWLAHNCRTVVHNAANLTFLGKDRRREPWLSNVEGTQRVLDLCLRCKIEQFHHVSTAYVCGLRSDRVLETELDVGQEMGNDYERSKIEAETLVRGAGLASPPTIYRPSIIVGDSRTGYTSTFHGFFALVKLAHTLAGRMVLGSITAEWLVNAFGLTGRERKDFVPVDWVSSVITHLLGNPEHHGKTYHLTAAEPTLVSVWGRAVQETVERYSPLADPSDAEHGDAAWFESMFRSQIQIYRAYWRDDPRFDRTNTVHAAPHLHCPVVDYDMLARMARFAIRTNFGKRARNTRSPDWDLRDPVQRASDPDELIPTAADDLHLGRQPGLEAG